MNLPVRPVVRPVDLGNQPNGTLDPSLLVSVGPSGMLHHLAARAFKAFQAAALSEGLPLTYSFGGCYRPYNQQETLFRQRYTPSFIAGQGRKWWNGQWWYLRKGMAMAAVPGTSNHGLGLAVDAAFDRDPSNGLSPSESVAIGGHPKFKWFVANADRFGFSFEVQSEPWHIRYVAGDTLPQAVVDFEKGTVAQMPPFNPDAGQYSLWPIASKPAAKLGDRGDQVRYLQGVLKNRAGQTVSVNGTFDAQTEAGVRNVQKFFGLAVDGWVGKQTWEIIDFLAVQK